MPYTPEQKAKLVTQICEGMIGSNVQKACKKAKVAESTFYLWLASDEVLSEEYARARKAVSYKGETELEDINRRVLANKINPKAANVASQNTRWLMGRRNPKVYGDSVDVTSKGDKLPPPAAATVAPEVLAEAMKQFKGSL